MNTKQISLFLLLIIVASVMVVNVFANEIDFYVSAQIPENQIDDGKTYFDLRMQPEQKQDIFFDIVNTSYEKIKVKIALNDSYTNAMGQVDYYGVGKNDNIEKISINDLAKLSANEVNIGANKKAKIKVSLTMPPEEFDGEVIGGIVATKAPDSSIENQSININNIYNYVLGIRITENDNIIEPEFKLNKVSFDLVNARPALVHEIQNIKPVLFNDAKLNIKIYEKNNSKVIYSYEQELLKMAPASTMEHVLYLDENIFSSGSYRTEVEICDENQIWTLTKNFEVTDNALSNVYKNSVGIEKSEVANRHILIVVLLILTIILTVLIYKIIKTIEQEVVVNKNKEDSNDQ